MERTYSQIDMDERRKIARWRTAGISVDVIAEKLGRHRSTIFRELRRNAFTDLQMPELNGYYCVRPTTWRVTDVPSCASWRGSRICANP